MIIPEDPTAVLDYTVDWDRKDATSAAGTGWLAPTETIVTSTWIVPTGITQATPSPSIINAGKATTIWLTGGTAGQSYVVANHITTSQGRQDQRTFTVYVEAR
ncbi:MAG: phage fiber-tail adaptor protein [Mycobacteriaceae bacterium]